MEETMTNMKDSLILMTMCGGTKTPKADIWGIVSEGGQQPLSLHSLGEILGLQTCKLLTLASSESHSSYHHHQNIPQQ